MKLAIGLITYNKNSAKYLPYFFDSLKEQTFKDIKVYVIDNSDNKENENKDFFIKHNDIDFEWVGGNIGYAKAYNKMIRKAVKSGAQYFLALNLDMMLETTAIEKMIKSMEEDEKLGSISPKILKWNFEKKEKTNSIDSCGIKMKSGLSFIDVGQSENDNSQYDDIEILGPSGAAAMYRTFALEKVKQNNEYFDELMFMYKEDCDLAYRLNLSGYKSKCVGGAIIYHDRTASSIGENDLQVALNRRNKSQQVKEWSFLNQHIIFIKYWKIQNLYNKINIIIYITKMFVFAILFERYLLKQYVKLRSIKNKINCYL